MLLQIKKIRKNKKAISVMIGYILLITFAILMSVIIYAWLKTYTPTDSLDCPDSTSMFITHIECAGGAQLNLTLKNNGKFDTAGYFIKATTEPDQKIAILDLSGSQEGAELNITAGDGGLPLNPGVKYLGDDNSMKPGDERNNMFDLLVRIYSVEITPIRYQEDNNKKRPITCSGSTITQDIVCPPLS